MWHTRDAHPLRKYSAVHADALDTCTERRGAPVRCGSAWVHVHMWVPAPVPALACQCSNLHVRAPTHQGAPDRTCGRPHPWACAGACACACVGGLRMHGRGLANSAATAAAQSEEATHVVALSHACRQALSRHMRLFFLLHANDLAQPAAID